MRKFRGRLQDAHKTIDQLQTENERLQGEDSCASAGDDSLSMVIQHDAVQAVVDVEIKDNGRPQKCQSHCGCTRRLTRQPRRGAAVASGPELAAAADRRK